MSALVRPASRYQHSFLAAVHEYQAEGLVNYSNLDISQLELDFSSYLQQLADEAEGKNLPDGYLPHTVFWLVDGDEYIGRVDIRHGLSEALRKEGGHIGYDIRPSKRRQGYGNLALKLGLIKAKELGLDKVLITCDVANVGSNKIIKANGGVLENTQPMTTNLPAKNRYWLSTKEVR